MAPVFNLVSCGCFDTVSHDIPDNRAAIVTRVRRRRELSTDVGTIEVIVLDTHEAG